MNIGYIGDKGQGKSYMLARELVRTLKQNQRWHEHYELPRRRVAVMRTLGLAPWFKETWGNYLTYFDEIQEIVQYKECDIFVDDISMRLDSRNWELLPQGAREWLYGSERLGCDLYFTAQKFSRVEITFRLLTDCIYLCTKAIGSPRPSATRPSVNRIWGIIQTCEIPKSEFQQDSFNQDLYGGGRPYLLRKRFTNVYDHTNISLSKGYAPFQHIERTCNSCGFIKAKHV